MSAAEVMDRYRAHMDAAPIPAWDEDRYRAWMNEWRVLAKDMLKIVKGTYNG